jgi:hypothetical protein
MAAIEQMEYGQLDPFFKPAATASGPRRGPYYKRQVWRDGKNQTEYVPAAQVPAVKDAIVGRTRFEQLADEFVAVTVAATRAARSDGKKKPSKPRRPVSRKPKRS